MRIPKRRAAAIVLACMGSMVVADAHAVPLRTLPGLNSISLWERTGNIPDGRTFAAESARLTVRLEDPLARDNEDFHGMVFEHYDIFYSNAAGLFDLDGAFLSIEATNVDPVDAGLNIAAVRLNFADNTSEFAAFVASVATPGPLKFPETAVNALGNDLTTHSALGNTLTNSSPRLRLTLGFTSSSPPVPEPSALLLLATGLAGVAAAHRCKRRARARRSA